MVQDDSAESIAEELHIEVEQQTDVVAGQFQVCQNLRDVDGVEPIDRFQLDYYAAFDKQIDPIAAVELRSLVNDGNRHLTLDGDTHTDEFVHETLLIGRLEQPGPQLAVHRDRGANDPLGCRIDV
ncbi:MAG TPA: hypothetical protein VMM79_08140, partial [Longimicrobiales bacterium]|nr:hypothetical protein [Longimicrobiales bacterium]